MGTSRCDTARRTARGAFDGDRVIATVVLVNVENSTAVSYISNFRNTFVLGKKAVS
jgi:hypothetical protein